MTMTGIGKKPCSFSLSPVVKIMCMNYLYAPELLPDLNFHNPFCRVYLRTVFSKWRFIN